MFPQISATPRDILTDVLCNIVGCGDWIPDRPQRTEAEFLLIIRPIHEITLDQFLRLRIPEFPDRRLRQTGKHTVNVPGSILMLFRDKKKLDLGAIRLPLVPDELGELQLELVQIVAVKLPLIQCAGEKPFPGITECILQHHIPGAAEIAIQLDLIVLLFLRIAYVHGVRIPVAFEGYHLVDIVSISVDTVSWRNAHAAITSRNSIWCQVASVTPTASLREAHLNRAYLPTFSGKGRG